MATPNCVMFKRISSGLLARVSATAVTKNDKSNKMALYALFNTRSPIGWHMKNFYTYRQTAFRGHWIDMLHSEKKKMGANAFKKHLEAMKLALELDISDFKSLMLKDGRQVVEQLATVLVKRAFDFESMVGSGVDAETKQSLQTALAEEGAKVQTELHKLHVRESEIKSMQTAGLQKLANLQAYLEA